MAFLAELKDRRRMRREALRTWNESERERGRRTGQARVKMATALGEEKVLARGGITFSPSPCDVFDPKPFALTATRLLWNSGENPEVKSLDLADVRTFSVRSNDPGFERFHLRLKDGTKLVVGFVPEAAKGVMGTPRYVLSREAFSKSFVLQLEVLGALRIR